MLGALFGLLLVGMILVTIVWDMAETPGRERAIAEWIEELRAQLRAQLEEVD